MLHPDAMKDVPGTKGPTGGRPASRWLVILRTWHRAHTLSGLLARIAARIVAYTIGLYINIFCLKRPMCRLADLLI